jgi:hypothetical protein
MFYCLDGGTLGMRLSDIYGNQIDMSVDCNRIHIEVPESIKEEPGVIERIEKTKQVCIYLGGVHKDDAGIEKIEFRSQLERRVLNRLRELIKDNPQYENNISDFILASQRIRDVEIEYK